jgi:hypothetical protein
VNRNETENSETKENEQNLQGYKTKRFFFEIVTKRNFCERILKWIREKRNRYT